MPDFLLEIGTEEIPARMIESAWREMTKRVLDLLTNQSLFTIEQATERLGNPEAGGIGFFLSATPRRLALVVPGISGFQPDVTEQMLGPSTKVAYKDGQPTPAAEAFAKKTGVDVSRLEKVTNLKGEYLAATVTRKGRKAAEILAEALPKEISGVYWAKNMYWRSGKPERFVRPVRWLLAMLDGEVVPLEFAGIKAGKFSRGHRILGPEDVGVDSPMQYAEALRNAHVMVAYGEREHRIRKALDAATRTVPDARWREDVELLKTVVNLTEWPSAILGSFDKEYLSLPEEVLVTVMRDHQKYFAVEDAAGKLAPHFLAVLNTDGDPDGLIRHGNERVLRARFNDARFFWDTDQKITLEQRVKMLSAVTFQRDLGSYYDKTGRVQKLATDIAMALHKAGLEVRADMVSEAAKLSKTDLTTELVKEFTELQGVIGGLYAKAQGLPQSVADAIYDQYKPESTEDSAPRTLEGAVLSIADKADSIAGMFGLGLVPSGSKDPFALRRQANGIVKTIIEHKLPLNLALIMEDARSGYQGSEAEKKFTDGPLSYKQIVKLLFWERLEFYLRDIRGLAYDVVNATLAAGTDDVVDAVARAEALQQVRSSADFAPLFIAFKRIKNIIKQAEEKSVEIRKADVQFEETAVESEIWQKMQGIGQTYLQLFGKKDYAGALKELARLRAPVDLYFDKVMVMVEDPQVRANRLGVLNYLLVTFNKIADLSELVVESK
jgi:glycyl-tRNA synthetase beta chain